MLNNLFNWLSINLAKTETATKNKSATASGSLPTTSPCCHAKINIAYRGLSDDRLYIAYGRNLSELKFFRPHNLRAYCQQCRKRLNQ